MKIKLSITLIALMLINLTMPMTLMAESWTSQGVTITYVTQEDGSAKVIDIINNSDKKIIPKIDGTACSHINANSSAKINRTAKRDFGYDYPLTTGDYYSIPVKAKVEEPVKQPEPIPEPDDEVPVTSTTASASNQKDHNQLSINTPTVHHSGSTAGVGYLESIEQDPLLSKKAIEEYRKAVDDYSVKILSASNKMDAINTFGIKDFLANSLQDINDKATDIPAISQEIVLSQNISRESQETIMNSIIETLTYRLNQRKEAYEKLNNIVLAAESANSDKSDSDSKLKMLNYLCIAGIILAIIIILIFVAKKKKTKKDIISTYAPQQHSEGQGQDIIVRRRTTSILRKLSLDDVKDNPSYLKISSSDFTADSAVRDIYIKNSCIKEVYNLYAEDLRNIEKPKEDGCMVLGRWTFDEATHKYDVSLESVVFPGDDAVFKEYELNFGGKIKLRIADKLRKLRRDTNLQYDLTCWIHSHPGLGVFFSNYDSNVQMQLKHAQHPNFLIAFVVDILTSDQELGIFTFRTDGSINSKSDLTKMYSLEEMYKWALESDKTTFNSDNYYNLLENAPVKQATCAGVELNNNSVIDLTQIIIGSGDGIIGWAIGFNATSEKGNLWAVTGIAKADEKPTAGILGCLISVTHMSLPTIQRLIMTSGVNINFVLVYSSKEQTLTTIPIVNDTLCTDEKLYGNVNIDDLKIWTRRKR